MKFHSILLWKAWEAMKDLLGGEERIDHKSSSWSDGFIFNFGTDELEKLDKDVAPQDLDNWHVDGDFFVCTNITYQRSML